LNKKLRAYFLISLLAICWGSIPLIIRTSDISSLSLVGIRTFLGTIFLLIFVLWKRQITKDLLYSGIFLGPLLAIHWSTMFKSIELNTVAIGIGLVFSYPIFILIIELLRRKNIKKFQVILIFTGFFGLYLLLDFSTISSVVGVVYGLVSAFSLAILIIYGSSKSLKFGGLNVAFVQVLFAAIILSPFTYEGFSWMIDNLLVSVFLGFFLTGIGLTTYWYVIKFIPPVSIGTITYLEPVTGVIIGAMILNESLRISQYIGFAIVLFIGIIQVIMDTKNQVQSF
jgi:drug/metabolite transporter (DMT)-like permease|tara:strand:+ start:69 stop:917 length:849 start_codon:yes stop_codon:yes gene_type:complete